MRATKVFLVVLLLALASTPYVIAACPETAAGAKMWSAGATWPSGSIPAANSDVVVPAGVTVVVDTVLPVLNSITVAGTLVFKNTGSPQNVQLKFIKVQSTGAVRAGSSDCRINAASKLTITFVGTAGTDDFDGFGTKGIGVLGGTLELWGETYGPTWTRLAATAAVGATQLTLKEAVQWRQGQRIIVASTDFFPSVMGSFNYSIQTEEVGVQSVSGTTVTIDTPLRFMHWGLDPEAAEVGLLSRAIVLQGDAASDATGFGGQTIFTGTNVPGGMKLSGVEFYRMGQKGVLGRYPVHWHRMKSRSGYGDFVSGCSMHHTYQRCVTIHDTQGILIADNVGYLSTGHCFFLEDGCESDNTLHHNLAALVRPGALIPSDDRAAGFWMTNLNNTWTNNAAVESHHGFWIGLPDRPIGASASDYANSITMRPRMIPLVKFDGNVAHGNEDSGLFVDEMPQANGVTELAAYTPYYPPYNASTWQLTPYEATFSNFITYKNRGHGIWTRSSYCIYDGIQSLDNTAGVQLVPGPAVIRNSYFECESANIGNPSGPNWLNASSYGGRSRPVPWTNNAPITAYQHYDAGGGVFVEKSRFANCASNSLRKASAHAILPNGKNLMEPAFYLSQLEYINVAMADRVYIETSWNSSTMKDGPRSAAINDLDGTTTGLIDGWILSNNTFFKTSPNCVVNSDWQAQLCPSTKNPFVFLTLQNRNKAGTNFAGTDVVSVWERATWYNLNIGAGSPAPIVGSVFDSAQRDEYRIDLPARGSYTIRFVNNHPTPPQVRLQALGLAKGEWVVVAIPYPSTTFTVVAAPGQYQEVTLTAGTSFNDLSYNQYYYHAASQHLYVRIENKQDGRDVRYKHQHYESWNTQVDVTAGCGSGCTISNYATMPPAVPAAAPGEEFYQTELTGCNGVPQVTTNARGTAYFFYNTRTHTLNYNIVHSIPGDRVTVAHLHLGSATDSLANSPVVYTFPAPYSPIRGQMALDWNLAAQLFKGMIFVNIHSTSNPAGELRGSIGCVGTCTPPAALPVMDACAALPTGSVVMYSNAAVSAGWGDWSWGSIRNFAYATDTACGASAVAITASTGALVFAKTGTPSTFTVPSGTAFLQFYVKWSQPYSQPSDALSLRIRVTDQNDQNQASLPEYIAGADSVATWAIPTTPSNTWTRVRVPIANLGITAGSTTIKRITFQQSTAYTGSEANRTWIMDEIAWIPNSADTFQAAIPSGQVYAYNPNPPACATLPPDTLPPTTAPPSLTPLPTDPSGNPVVTSSAPTTLPATTGADGSTNPPVTTVVPTDTNGSPVPSTAPPTDTNGNPLPTTPPTSAQPTQTDANGSPVPTTPAVTDASGNPVPSTVPPTDSNGQTIFPPPSTVPPNGVHASTGGKKKGISTPVIIAVVICGVIVVALIAGTLVYFLVIKGASAGAAKGYSPLFQTDPALLYSNPTISSQPYSMM